MSRAKRREPVTLVRSPTLTKSVSGPMSSGSRPARRVRRSTPGTWRGGRPRTAAAMAAMCSGRRAAAAAHDVEDARRSASSPSTEEVSAGRLVVAAEGVRQAGVRIERDVRVGDAGQLLRVRPQLRRAPRAQLRPTASGRAWRTLFQKAPTVWPESVRPERSVIVPLTMSGSREAQLLPERLDGEDGGLGVERVVDGLDEQQVGAARRRDRARPPGRRPRAPRSRRCAHRGR